MGPVKSLTLFKPSGRVQLLGHCPLHLMTQDTPILGLGSAKEAVSMAQRTGQAWPARGAAEDLRSLWSGLVAWRTVVWGFALEKFWKG